MSNTGEGPAYPSSEPYDEKLALIWEALQIEAMQTGSWDPDIETWGEYLGRNFR